MDKQELIEKLACEMAGGVDMDFLLPSVREAAIKECTSKATTAVEMFWPLFEKVEVVVNDKEQKGINIDYLFAEFDALSNLKGESK